MVIDVDFVEIAKDFLQMVSGELDPYTSEKGIIKEDAGKVTLFTPSHIQFAKYGRGPGKNPPLDAILAFVKKKGIIPKDGGTQKGTAFAIMKSIAKKGTKNYVANAPNALEEAITKSFKEYNEKLADKITVSINDELFDMYRDMMPTTISEKY